MTNINELTKFRDEHKDCHIYTGLSDRNTGYYVFWCTGHKKAIVVENVPKFCRYPSLDCAISGYCKREISCNHYYDYQRIG